MSIEAAKVGDIFKQARKAKNYSLKEVESATSIRESYLLSIEEGNFRSELSPVYMEGFMKQFAKFLDIDLDRIRLDFPEAFDQKGEDHEFTYGIGTLESRSAASQSHRWVPLAIKVGVSFGLLLIAYFFAKYVNVF